MNACVIAYGQTGSGKTYTVMNDILPQCLEFLSPGNSLKGHKLYFSCIEIYQDKINDLITGNKNLEICQNGNDFQIKKLLVHRITNKQELEDKIKFIAEN